MTTMILIRLLLLSLISDGSSAMLRRPSTSAERHSSLKAAFEQHRPRLADPIIVTTPFGKLLGSTDGVVMQLVGVPFAAPPTGPLRW
jgi:hypothetical protein